jgi:ribokinase
MRERKPFARDFHSISCATAAGDVFAGALAVEWAAGCALIDAVRFANCVGALAAPRDGAQPGMGTRKEIEALL